ncbi:MAG: hypothetical protein KAG66_04175, partial [Methylococcales bacterium]|nr:hypothetical protein [Methylococcales bacterium]
SHFNRLDNSGQVVSDMLVVKDIWCFGVNEMNPTIFPRKPVQPLEFSSQHTYIESTVAGGRAMPESW